MQKLAAAFPFEDATKAAVFFALMVERMQDNGFTSQRVRDAVNWVIDNFRYRQLAIADILSFDRRATLYTRNDYLKSSDKDDFTLMLDKDLNPVRIAGVAYYVKISDDPRGVFARRAEQDRRRRQNRELASERYAEGVRRLSTQLKADNADLTYKQCDEMAAEQFRHTAEYAELHRLYYEIPEAGER